MNILTCEMIVKIAELKSLARTAEYFSYTPSRISQLLKAAEDEFGLVLFYRGKAGLLPTTECQAMLPALRDLLDSQRQFQDQLSRLKQLQTGSIRIGAFTSLSCHWLPQRLKGFSAAYPNIQFELKLGDSDQIAQWVRTGAVDIGLTINPQAEDLRFQLLLEDSFAVVLPEDHPLARREALPLDLLQGESFIFLEPEDNRPIESHMEQLGFRPRVKYRVKDDYTIMALVENGLGVSILPRLVLNRAPYRIRAVELLPSYRRQVGIVLQKSRAVSHATQCLVSFWMGS